MSIEHLRSLPIVIRCCQCRRIKVDDTFIVTPPPPNVLFSDGYCPECASAVRAQLERMEPVAPPAAPEVRT